MSLETITGCTNSKVFCEGPIALQREQPDKYKQNVDVAPFLEKFLRTPMVTFTRSTSFDV